MDLHGPLQKNEVPFRRQRRLGMPGPDHSADPRRQAHISASRGPAVRLL